MKILYFLFALFLAACTTVGNIQPPSEKRTLVLDEDIKFSEILGIPRRPYLLGATKGTFSLIGEDKTGYYYIAETSKSFVLGEEDAKYFEANQKVPDTYKQINPFGIWYPKEHSTEQPCFFTLFKANDEGAAKMGPTIVVTAALIDGTLMKGHKLDKKMLDSKIRIEVSH
jgi:hypothetical protein